MSTSGQDRSDRISVLLGDFSTDPYKEGLYRLLSSHPEFEVTITAGLEAAKTVAEEGGPAVLIVEGSDPSGFLDRLEGVPNLSIVVLDSVGGRALIGLENPGSDRLAAIIRASATGTMAGRQEPPHERVRLVQPDELFDPLDFNAVSKDLRSLLEWLDIRFMAQLEGVTDHETRGIPGWSVTAFEAKHRLGNPDAPYSATSLAARLELVDDSLIGQRTTLPASLADIAAGFSLSAIELRILCLILAPELDGRYGTAIGVLQDDLTRRRPGLTLLGQLLEIEGLACDLRRLLEHSGSLRRNGLVAPVDERDSAVDVGYVASRTVVDHVLGIPAPTAESGSHTRLFPPQSNTRLTGEEQVVADMISSIVNSPQSPLLHLSGGDRLRSWFVRLCSSAGIPIVHGDLRLLGSGRKPTMALDDWRVLCGIHAAGLLVTGMEELDTAEQSQLFLELSALLGRLTVVATDAGPVVSEGLPTPIVVAAPQSSTAERAAFWQEVAGSEGLSLNSEEATRLASVVRTDGDGIGRLMAASAYEPRTSDDETVIDRVQRVARRLSRQDRPSAVRQIEAAYTWDDIVVPDAVEESLRTIPVHVVNAGKVLEEWRFSDRLPYGVGVAALFSGPSGTGKTMAAQIIAADLGVDLFHVDLSKTISKYIGETEKNLDLVFDAAERAGAILLFDEADALFGKRTEVKDAHDRHANVEVAYLLQRMESFRGLAILTSNFKQNIDQAFIRRLRFVVDFPLPSAGEREEIWKRSFPTQAPLLPEVDIAFLARRLSITGGSIQQIALHAAFGAAKAGERIGMSHIVAATRRELIKVGMLNAEKSLHELARSEVSA